LPLPHHVGAARQSPSTSGPAGSAGPSDTLQTTASLHRPGTRYGRPSPFGSAASQERPSSGTRRSSRPVLTSYLQQQQPPGLYPAVPQQQPWQEVQAVFEVAPPQQPWQQHSRQQEQRAPRSSRASEDAFTVSTAPSSTALDAAVASDTLRGATSGSCQGYELDFSADEEVSGSDFSEAAKGPPQLQESRPNTQLQPSQQRSVSSAVRGAARGEPHPGHLGVAAGNGGRGATGGQDHTKRQVSMRLISLGPETEVLAFEREEEELVGSSSDISDAGVADSDATGRSSSVRASSITSNGSSRRRLRGPARGAVWQAAAAAPGVPPLVAAPQTPPNQPGAPAVAAPAPADRQQPAAAPVLQHSVATSSQARQPPRLGSLGLEDRVGSPAPNTAQEEALADTEALHSMLVALPARPGSSSSGTGSGSSDSRSYSNGSSGDSGSNRDAGGSAFEGTAVGCSSDSGISGGRAETDRVRLAAHATCHMSQAAGRQRNGGASAAELVMQRSSRDGTDNGSGNDEKRDAAASLSAAASILRRSSAAEVLPPPQAAAALPTAAPTSAGMAAIAVHDTQSPAPTSSAASTIPSCDIDGLIAAEGRRRRRQRRAQNQQQGCRQPPQPGGPCWGPLDQQLLPPRARRSVRLQVSAGRDVATQAELDQLPNPRRPGVLDRSKLIAPWRFPAGGPAGQHTAWHQHKAWSIRSAAPTGHKWQQEPAAGQAAAALGAQSRWHCSTPRRLSYCNALSTCCFKDRA
jgi:hypothetical protein